MKYIIWRSIRTGEWHWHLKAKNGKILASGESYKNKKDCMKTVNLINNSTGLVVETRN